MKLICSHWLTISSSKCGAFIQATGEEPVKSEATKRSVRFDPDTKQWEVLQNGKVFAQLEDEPIARELAAPEMYEALARLLPAYAWLIEKLWLWRFSPPLDNQ